MSIRRSLVWTAGGQLVLFIVQFGSQVVLSRILTPYEVGISAIAFTISGLLNIMQTFGLRNLVIRERELPPSMVETAFTMNLILAALVSSLIFFGAHFGQALYHEKGVERVLALIAIIPLLNVFELRPSAMLQRSMKFGPIAVASVAKTVVASSVTVSMALLGFSYMSIVYGAIAGAVSSLAIFMLLGRSHLQLTLSLKHWRYVTRFGMHMLAINGVNGIATRLVDLIIGHTLGLAVLGLFSRASALNNVLWENIHSVFTRVVFSSFANERRATGSLRKSYLRTVETITALLWPAFIGLAILAGPAVHLLYGEKWMGAAPVLQMFAIAAALATSTTMAWEVFVICERTGEQAKFEFVRSGLTVLATVIGAPFGARAASCARIVDSLVAFGIYRRPLSQMTETRLVDLIPIYRRSLMLTAVAVLPAVVAMVIYHWRGDAPLPYVFLSVGVGAAGWFAAIMFTGHPLAEEITLVWRKVCRWAGIGGRDIQAPAPQEP
jgi:O-antigen/teichoic acid export membrane protein